jgi:DNA-binding NarL/FixJ family response regulator
MGKEVLHIIQEALNNVRKHAGVKTAQVILLRADDHVTVIVADNGAGFDVDGGSEPEAPEGQTEGFGLTIMRERAEAIGATLRIYSAPGAGTQVTVCVPVNTGAPVQPVTMEMDEAPVVGLRVLLVDDHPLFLEGLRNMLTVRGVQVVGTALDGIEAQALAHELLPDVILMDMNMPRCDGLEATALIKAELPQIKVIMLTVAADQEKLFQALRAGASGYLLKSLDSSEFFQLLSEAMHGEIVLSQGLAEQALSAFARRASMTPAGASHAGALAQPANPLLTLSARQRDILERAAQGSTYKEIASALFLSEATVKYHMGQIIELLQVENRREAIAVARQAGMG